MVRRQEGQLGRREVVRRADIGVIVGGIFLAVCCAAQDNNHCNGRPSMLRLVGGGELAEMERAWRRTRQMDPGMAMRLKLHDVCSLIRT